MKDLEILEEFGNAGMQIRFGETYSAKGQIAQLINGARSVLARTDSVTELKYLCEILEDEGFPTCPKCLSYAVDESYPPSHACDYEHGETPAVTCFKCKMCEHVWAD